MLAALLPQPLNFFFPVTTNSDASKQFQTLEKFYFSTNQKYMKHVSIYLNCTENIIENISPSIKAIDLEIGIWSGSAKCTPTYFFNCNKYLGENVLGYYSHFCLLKHFSKYTISLSCKKKPICFTF